MDNLGSHNWNQFDNIKRKYNALSFGQNTRALSELKPTISISECRYCLAECLRAGDTTTIGLITDLRRKLPTVSVQCYRSTRDDTEQKVTCPWPWKESTIGNPRIRRVQPVCPTRTPAPRTPSRSPPGQSRGAGAAARVVCSTGSLGVSAFSKALTWAFISFFLELFNWVPMLTYINDETSVVF